MSSSSNADENGPIAASTNNFDNISLSSLIRKLQLAPSAAPAAANNSASRQALEEILAELELELGDEQEDEDEEEEEEGDSSEEMPGERHRARVMKEERKLEQEIVKIIHSGKTESLKANTGEAICINDHYVCITSHEEKEDADYRVWEWHGHIMTYTESSGFDPEYFYGNYFERMPVKVPFNLWNQKARQNQQEEEEEEEEEEEAAEEPALDLGLRGLISGLNCTSEGRVLHRNVNADSQSFL